MRIVFFGTPEFASKILEDLVEKGYQIVGVVTTPDRASGRGHRLQPSAVKETAQRLIPEVPVLQPEKLRDQNFLHCLESLAADLFVVVAFRMLPVEVWSMPEKGTFNLHASLLPKYRGAAPIQHAILNGEQMTGVTTFMLDEKIDTGRILLQREMPIAAEETGGTLHDKLMQAGAELVSETINLIQAAEPGSLLGTEQAEFMQSGDHALPTAPKIFRQDRELHFTRDSAQKLLLRIRAMSPYPGALATLDDGREFKVLEGRLVPEHYGGVPGTILVNEKKELIVQTVDEAVQLLVIQAPSRRMMKAEDFLLGHTLSGTFL